MAKSRGRGPTLAKDMNRIALYRQIKRMRTTTRAELARQLELNKNTVNAIVDELTRAGYVRESGPQATGAAGRNPVGIRFHAANNWAIGVQVTATDLYIAATDLYGEPFARVSAPLANRSPETVLGALAEGANRLLASHARDRCIGIGVGIPALLDSERTSVTRSSHMNWSDVPVAALLAPRVPLPLLLDNSVKLSTLGELQHGAGQGSANFAYCHFGSGVGCGIIAGGAIVRGEANAAGEMGHIVVDPDGPPCACGNRGCLEALVGFPALADRFSRVAGVPRERVTMQWLLAELGAGNEAVAAEMRRVGQAIGHALATLVNLLNPGLLICDGTLMDASAHLFPVIREELAQRCLPSLAQQVSLVRSALYPWAGALGAAAAVVRQWEETIDPLALVTD